MRVLCGISEYLISYYEGVERDLASRWAQYQTSSQCVGMGMGGDRSLTVMSDHSSLGTDTMKLEIKKRRAKNLHVPPILSLVQASPSLLFVPVMC